VAFKEVQITAANALELSRFREMDYFAVEAFDLPIELMMENAGLQLANLVAHVCKGKENIIQIGVGNGNNGGGGLVAARRLSAWGYHVCIDVFTELTKELPLKQLERALKFGAKLETHDQPDVWVDAYLGFSQRLPLSDSLLKKIELANSAKCPRISLDIPTGFLGDIDQAHFEADHVLSLAAMKKILFALGSKATLYIADLGIPLAVYEKFGVQQPDFADGNILRIKRDSNFEIK